MRSVFPLTGCATLKLFMPNTGKITEVCNTASGVPQATGGFRSARDPIGKCLCHGQIVQHRNHGNVFIFH